MDDLPNIDPIEKYIDAILNNTAFATLLGIFSLGYAYYLYQKAKSRSRLLVMSMSNGQREEVRKTEIVVYNDGYKDLTKKDVLKGDSIRFDFNKKLRISEIAFIYKPSKNNKFELIEVKPNKFRVKFEILKKGEAFVLKVMHDSKLHMDDVWKEFKVRGTIIDVAILRDDFSDQMVYRANSINIPLYLGAFILTFVLTYTEKIILLPFSVKVPDFYLLIGNFFLSIIILTTWLLNKVGHREYTLFWKALKKARKN